MGAGAGGRDQQPWERQESNVDELGPSPAYNPSLILLGTKKTWLNDFFFNVHNESMGKKKQKSPTS